MRRALVSGSDFERVHGLDAGVQGLLQTYNSRTFLDGELASARVLKRIQNFAIHPLKKQRKGREEREKEDKRNTDIRGQLTDRCNRDKEKDK